jgi:hypothetical protein
VSHLVIIQTGTTHALLVKGEAQWFDQVQQGTGIGYQTNDVARIGRDFGFIEGNMQHVSIMPWQGW